MEGLEETAALLNQAIDDVEASFSTEMNGKKRYYFIVNVWFIVARLDNHFSFLTLDSYRGFILNIQLDTCQYSIVRCES